MLKLCNKLSEIKFSQLCDVYGYDQGGIGRQNDLYDYLYEDFFRVRGAFYALWESQGCYVSALRAEPYRDGYLIEALETHPAERERGYAKSLLDAVLHSGKIPAGHPVYAHVHKKNAASLAVHAACGFERVLEHAVFIDGSVYQHSCTLRWSE